MRDPLGSGEVAEESVAGEQNVVLGLGECERKAVGLGECGVTILVGQSEDLAGGVEFDDLKAKSRKVGIELSTQFEGVHLIGNGELPGEMEERLKQASPFQIQQNRGVGDDDGHGSVIFCSVAVMCWEADTSDRLGHGY